MTRANGVTTAAVMPGGGIFGGEVAVMNLDGWTWEEAMLRPTAGISFKFPALGGGVAQRRRTRRAGSDRTYDDLKRDRDEKLDEVSQLFDQARAYMKAAGPNRQTDWTLESLVPVVERTLPLFTDARTARRTSATRWRSRSA